MSQLVIIIKTYERTMSNANANGERWGNCGGAEAE